MKPICRPNVIVLDTILKINYFCTENNGNYIYSYEKLHKKLLPPELPFLTQICTKSFVGWRFAPDPTGGAYSAPPDPLAVFRGLLVRNGREKEGRGRAEEGKGGRGREMKGGEGGKGRRGKGRGGPP